MKLYKIELMVLDLDQIGEEEIKGVLENTKYPNRCISPEVKKIEVRDIGEWHDEHPLNKRATCDAEYQRLFAPNARTQRPGASDAPIATESAPPGSLE